MTSAECAAKILAVAWNHEFRENDIASSEYRINQDIRAYEVRIISESEGNLGVFQLDEAIEMAQRQNLDLVEVSPHADPPVCRVMDYGKFIYDKRRKERRARKLQKTVEVKGIRLRPKTDGYHLGFKVKEARRWLSEGKKVRVTILFRGRERSFPEIGQERMTKIADELSDVGTIEQMPNMEGRSMTMLLTPIAETSATTLEEAN
ncbi:MAG: translation initiation factor IF-3 [Chloroflexi bacterium]|nr:translation initiation factor IF-3 [Chloroflexota bacterium]